MARQGAYAYQLLHGQEVGSFGHIPRRTRPRTKKLHPVFRHLLQNVPYRASAQRVTVRRRIFPSSAAAAGIGLPIIP